MPFHPGFNASYSTWQQHQQQQQQQQQQLAAAVTPPAGIGSPQFDPQAMSMYALQPPSFSEMFDAAASEPSAFTQMPPEMHIAPTVTPGSSAAGAAQGAMAQGPPLSSEEMAFTNNTLAMWSNAPTSFE